MLKAANYLTHLEHDWPVWRHWLESFSRQHTLLRYDQRGSGLSDRNAKSFTMDAWVDDLHAVSIAAGYERFPILGISQGASVAVAYALRYPERVSRLILYGGYARGRSHRNLTPDEFLEAETMINAIRLGWGRPNPAFRQLFSSLLMPEGTTQQHQQLNELASVSAAPETAARMEAAFYDINVEALAALISVPTLVLHARNDMCIPFEEGRHLAALIPRAEFVPLDSNNHILLEEEPAWTVFRREVDRFLQSTTEQGKGIAGLGDLSTRELDILDNIAQGKSNDQIAEHCKISEKTVRNHITSIYSKLEVSRRAEAIIMAREAGLGIGDKR
ncbi:MAG: alpha/beta fold hydrolase [Pseudomonadales bacterium]